MFLDIFSHNLVIAYNYGWLLNIRIHQTYDYRDFPGHINAYKAPDRIM